MIYMEQQWEIYLWGQWSEDMENISNGARYIQQMLIKNETIRSCPSDAAACKWHLKIFYSWHEYMRRGIPFASFL